MGVIVEGRAAAASEAAGGGSGEAGGERRGESEVEVGGYREQVGGSGDDGDLRRTADELPFELPFRREAVPRQVSFELPFDLRQLPEAAPEAWHGGEGHRVDHERVNEGAQAEQVGQLPVFAGESTWKEQPQPEARVAMLADELPVERPSLVQWEPALLEKPLRVGAKTINWGARRRTGVETYAGLMSKEQATSIAEPLSEIMNRHDTLRALAAKGVELNLAIAVYDYAQHAIVVAGIDMARAERGLSPLPPPEGYTDLVKLQQELAQYRLEDERRDAAARGSYDHRLREETLS